MISITHRMAENALELQVELHQVFVGRCKMPHAKMHVALPNLHSSQTVISISVHKKDIQVIHFVVIKSSYSINTSESCSSDDEP